MTHKEYLDSIIAEVIADKDWAIPVPMRGMLLPVFTQTVIPKEPINL